MEELEILSPMVEMAGWRNGGSQIWTTSLAPSVGDVYYTKATSSSPMVATGKITTVSTDWIKIEGSNIQYTRYADYDELAEIQYELKGNNIVEGYLHNGQFYQELSHLTTLVPESGKLYIDRTNNINATYIWDDGFKVLDNNKAAIDGYYDTLGAGYAATLMGNGSATSEMITFRPSGGVKDIASGVATIKNLYGKTIVWNQLAGVSSKATFTSVGVTHTNNGNGTWTINGTATAYATPGLGIPAVNVIAGHKYLLKGSCGKGFTLYIETLFASALNDTGEGAIGTAINSGTSFIWSSVRNASTFSGDKVAPMLIDLTQMFGAGNEPSTVEEFQALFPNSYYAYNAGQLVSFNGEGIKTVGVNQWDEEWEIGLYNSTGQKLSYASAIRCKNLIKVISGETYCITCKSMDIRLGNGMCFYDSNKSFVSREMNTILQTGTIITIPDNVQYITFDLNDPYGTTYNHDIQIALYHSGGEIPTTYHPYEEHTLPLPINSITSGGNVIFADGLKSAGTARDYLYGVVNGRFTKARKVIGIMDLGMLTWGGSTATGYEHSFQSDAGVLLDNDSGNLTCSLYIQGNKTAFIPSANDKQISIRNYLNRTFVTFADSNYTTSNLVNGKAPWLNGVQLYYELAEPIDYELDTPIPTTYFVNDWGTEELLPNEVDTQGVPKTTPMYADIVYGPNIQDSVRRLQNAIGNIKDTFTDLIGKLGTAIGKTISVVWSGDYNSKGTFTITDNNSNEL